MAQDQFADLLSGITRKRDDSKLPLHQRQQASSTPSAGATSSSSPWANFDILDKPSTRPQTPSTLSNDLFEGFDVLNSSNGQRQPQQQQQPQQKTDAQEHLFEGFAQQPAPSSSLSNFDLLDSFDFVSTEPPTPLNSTVKPQPQPSQQAQSFDDLFSVFDAPPKAQTPSNTPVARPQQQQQPQSQPQTRPASQPSNNDAYDEAIASIVDMGFSAEQAVRALKHTKTGLDVQGAIDFIMTKAHNQSRAKAGLPPQNSRHAEQKRRGNATEDYIQGFSKLMSAATKKVMAVQSQLMTPPPVNDGRPAWMRDAEKYKRRGPHYDEDPEMISTEELNKLTLEKPEPPKPRRQSSARPQQPAPVKKPEPEIDLFAPIPTKPEPEVDLFSSSPPVDLFTPASNTEMRTSSRRRTTPRPTTTSSTPTKTRAQPSISSTQLEFYKDSKTQGATSFKNGDFSTALQHYETALSSLPEGHVYQIVTMSNLVTCYFKVGENRKVLDTSTRALALIGEGKGVGEEIDGKSMKEFWIKIMTKRAEALEHLEKFKEALECWTTVIENGGASKQGLDAKRRLMDVLNPKPKPKPKATPRPKPVETEKKYEAAERVKEEHKQQEKFEEEKFKLHDVVETKISNWKNGKEDNLRALLASLDTILWPESQWKKVGMSDLVLPKKVKICYLKAVAKTHPDKVSSSATSEQKMIAQSVFVVLNSAWEVFKQQNGIN